MHSPLSLLLLDLDGFKPINDTHGHAAGDELLRWVGTTLAQLAPADASAGRMGGDEFAVTLPATDQRTAAETAEALAEAIGARIGVSIGRATFTPGAQPADPDRLMREADLELYATKRGARHSRGGTSARAQHEAPATQASAEQPPSPPLSYARLRARHGHSSRTLEGIPPLVLGVGFLVLAVGGLVLLTGQLLHGGDSIYQQVIRYGMAPWLLTCVGLAVFFLRQRELGPRLRLVAVYSPVALIGSAMTTLALAGDGIVSPVMLALPLKVMFDAFALRHAQSVRTLILILAGWAVAAVLGPADALWAAPFQLAIFGCTFALGFVANRAFNEATSSVLGLAHTDPLTGLRNRQGFDAAADRALQAATQHGAPFGLLVFDLDDFKSVNDTLGHAAGDALLQAIAGATTASLPAAYGIARIDGDEFAALVPLSSPAAAAALAQQLTQALAELRGASVGYATYSEDGTTIEALVRAADQRAYLAKRARRAGDHAPVPTG